MLSMPSVPEIEARAPLRTELPPVRILIVDDRIENLVALEGAFQGLGYELVLALSGAEAVELIREREFALVLLDVQMPSMDGFQTARLIRQVESARHTPIIFVTAIHRTEEYEQKGYIAGAVDYLFKPVDTDILLAKVAVFADLYRKTQQVKIQAELLREQALREQENRFLRRAVELRDEFLSMASHELNTPITPLGLQLQSFIRLIENGRMESVDVERLKRMLNSSYAQVKRLSRIVRELLDVSRLSTGRLELIKEEIDLTEVVQSVVDGFSEEIRRLECQVRVSVHGEVVKGNWDRIRIEQVIINLLSNALKYGAGKPVEIQVELKDDLARIEVRDQGIGISKGDQKRIFERYERAVSSQNYGGLGLGLYITTEIVRLHGGTIFVKSELGQGSTFVVELPVRHDQI